MTPAGTAPRLDVVIVAFESRDRVLAALGSLAAHAGLPTATRVVDNASSDGVVEAVRAAFPEVQVIANHANRGFSSACNQGWRAGSAPAVLFLNPDALVAPGALPALLQRLESHKDLGIAGPLTRNPDGSVQVSTGPDLTLRSERQQRRLVKGVARRDPAALARAAALHSAERAVDWVSGACLMARRSCLEPLGGFDEGFFLYEEDADLCRRARMAGWRVLFTPAAEVVHELGTSMARAPGRAAMEYQRSHLRYYRKHNGGAAVAVLRGLVAVRGVAGWLRGAIERRPEARRHSAALLRLALRDDEFAADTIKAARA